MKRSKSLALEMKDLTVHYGTSPALWNLNLDVPKGHLVGIMGPNGAGKTTFIKAILGFLSPYQGKVLILSEKLDHVKNKIAYIPQRDTIDWDFPLTVYDLVKMGRFAKRGLFRALTKEDRQAIDRALSVLGLLPLSSLPINQLSGGQKQRAFIARALAQDADVYFLDEPFSGVDHASEDIIVKTFHQMKEEEKTIFVVHHDLFSASKYFDWLILLNTRLVASGPFSRTFSMENLQLTYGKDLVLLDEVLKMRDRYDTGSKIHGAD